MGDRNRTITKLSKSAWPNLGKPSLGIEINPRGDVNAAEFNKLAYSIDAANNARKNFSFSNLTKHSQTNTDPRHWTASFSAVDFIEESFAVQFL
jgi:hypothetical protein